LGSAARQPNVFKVKKTGLKKVGLRPVKKNEAPKSIWTQEPLHTITKHNKTETVPSPKVGKKSHKGSTKRSEKKRAEIRTPPKRKQGGLLTRPKNQCFSQKKTPQDIHNIKHKGKGRTKQPKKRGKSSNGGGLSHEEQKHRKHKTGKQATHAEASC